MRTDPAVIEWGMHSRSWNRCLAQDSVTGTWCQRRPSDGVFCPPHTSEFRFDEAAKAATRLEHARLVVWDPTSTPFQRWWASVQIRSARSLRRSILAKVAEAEDHTCNIASLSADLVPPEDISTWK